jgi:hypothetical protein
MVPAQRRRQDGGSSSDVNGCQLELRLVCVPEEFLAEEIDGHRSCDTDPMRHRTSALCWEPRGWRGGRLPRAAELLQPEDGGCSSTSWSRANPSMAPRHGTEQLRPPMWNGVEVESYGRSGSDVEWRRGGGLLRARRLRCGTMASTRSLAAAMAEQRRTHTMMGMADVWVHAQSEMRMADGWVHVHRERGEDG